MSILPRQAEAGGQLTALIAKVSKMCGVQSHTFWTFGVVRLVCFTLKKS